MRRRDFIKIIVGFAIVWPLVVHAQPAPTTVTVPLVSVSPGYLRGPRTVTVTQIVAGPPQWGYKVSGGPPATPARWDRISIDFDASCNAPKSSGRSGPPKIIPSVGQAQHYVLLYPTIVTSAVITVTCDAKRTGSANFEMLEWGVPARVLTRTSPARVAGPGR
jgi:hypothetical protein